MLEKHGRQPATETRQAGTQLGPRLQGFRPHNPQGPFTQGSRQIARNRKRSFELS